MLKIFLFSVLLAVAASTSLPVVLVHGILSDLHELEPIEQWLHNNGVEKTYRLEIGDGVINSFTWDMNTQLQVLCESIYNFSELSQGFNIIGISQGGLLARGYVENCNIYPVKNLITLGTPHQGVFYENFNWPNMYSQFQQNHLSFSNYWKDTNRYAEYLQYCAFLPFINNERMHSKFHQFRTNMLSLNNFVMVWSEIDGVISPVESCKFEWNDEDQPDHYNLLGLTTLKATGRLHILQAPCIHMEYKQMECLGNLLLDFI